MTESSHTHQEQSARMHSRRKFEINDFSSVGVSDHKVTVQPQRDLSQRYKVLRNEIQDENDQDLLPTARSV